jgi:hypothetical protein
VSQFKEQQGFATFAVNSKDTNYLELAYLQCLNIKATQQKNSYAVIVDTATNELVTDQHRRVFDYVIVMDGVDRVFDKPYGFEALVNHTPFKETIKVESDLLFTRSIDHWWTAFRLKNVCLSTGAVNYQGVRSTVRKYREVLDVNNLPDVYNGLMYFRYSKESTDFFSVANSVFINWAQISQELRQFDTIFPSTDVVYAITAEIIGRELVTMPSVDFINFVHMKSGFNGWSDNRSWIDTVMNERDGDVIRINNLNQYAPVHYYDKSYATKELIEYYEQRVLERG